MKTVLPRALVRAVFHSEVFVASSPPLINAFKLSAGITVRPPTRTAFSLPLPMWAYIVVLPKLDASQASRIL